MTVSGTIDVHTPIAGLVDLALRDPSLQEVARRAADRPADLHLVGPAGARLYVAVACAQSGPLLVVTATGREADDLVAELRGVLGDAVALFPSWETLPHERLSPGVDTVGARMMLLRRLSHPDDARLGPPLRIVVTTARSLLQPMALRQRSDEEEFAPVELTVGADLGVDGGFDGIIARLVDLAYTRVDMVGKRGEFAVRGGILDIFPPTFEHPVRIEFWGDEVSEMRMFSVADQRSISEIDIDTVIAVPCREVLLTAAVRDRAAALSATHPVQENSVPGSVPDMLAKLAEGIPVDGMEALLPLLRPTDLATLPDHLPVGAALLICDPEKVRTRAADLIKAGREFLEASWSTAAIGGGVPIDLEAMGASGFVGFDAAREAARSAGRPWWTLSRLDDGSSATVVGIRPAPSARGKTHNVEEIFAMLRAHVSVAGSTANYAVVVTPGTGTAMRVVEQLGEADAPAAMLEPGAVPREGVVGVLKGPLRDGVVIPGANLVVITEADLTGNRAAAAEGRRLAAKRRNVVDPLALTAGDLVVHDQHGIGRFVEMTERVIGGARREYLVLEYGSAKRGSSGNSTDKLYVPMDSLDQLSRYVGGEAPSLSRLGGSDWANTKTKARRAVREIAAELVTLYAKRQASAGHAFNPDTPWQTEMEDAFGFTETVDQLTAITEVKSDMQKAVPMDRVICGDVGYGKTEIAVRAAFKAVQDGKQVAVLVPTTLLADQHLQTFTARMAGFPVTVKGLSRFTDPAQSRETLEGMKDGSVDIAIGTHRLLQTGVTWKDLGLVVVDEEQRFGVEHKEHIKSMRTHVDVLTMSATPIPRTLEMSLAGIREMSTILTPPEERYPVLTYVGPHDDKQVAAALRREMLRDGQVFYIHNRVRTIDQAAARVRALVPEARVVVAHGQMPEEQLERTVEGFWNREYDILVC
ncbi:MAG: transcription-repair coupling factor, partial [Mycobacterium sp.]